MKGEGLQAFVIGCGRIGALWDRPGDVHVRTHAHGLHRDPRIGALVFVDTNASAATEAAARWNGNAFSDLRVALAAGCPALASVCASDDAHYAIIDQLLDAGVPLILAEKPLTTNVVDAERLIRKAGNVRSLISVNFSRRFDPALSDTIAQVRAGAYGRPLTAVGIYTNGILHNGSHMIDLLRQLFGDMQSAQVLASRAGHTASDPGLDCWLSFAGCPSVHLVAGDESSYSIFELDLLCERARIRFTRSTCDVQVQTARPDPAYAGFRDLGKPQSHKTDLAHAIEHYLDDGIRALTTGSSLASPAHEALATQRVCQALITMHERITLRG